MMHPRRPCLSRPRNFNIDLDAQVASDLRLIRLACGRSRIAVTSSQASRFVEQQGINCCSAAAGKNSARTPILLRAGIA
jgi:hypothetical protein